MDEELTKIIHNHEKRIKALEDFILDEGAQKLKKEMSIKEFILSKKPKSDVHRALVIGYFLENYEGLSSFNSVDLQDAFRAAKENVPNNINLCVIRNIKKGHMMESKEKKDHMKSWTLTSSGEKSVENEFKKE